MNHKTNVVEVLQHLRLFQNIELEDIPVVLEFL